MAESLRVGVFTANGDLPEHREIPDIIRALGLGIDGLMEARARRPEQIVLLFKPLLRVLPTAVHRLAAQRSWQVAGVLTPADEVRHPNLLPTSELTLVSDDTDEALAGYLAGAVDVLVWVGSFVPTAITERLRTAKIPIVLLTL